MKINEIKCKTALSKSSLPGLDYSLNPYRGCQHKCIYCYVPNVLRIERKNWGSFVDVKTNMPIVLSKELNKKKPGVVGISTVTDPYQPVENKYKLTRYCLEQLIKHDFPICIQTKSDLVLRDIDIISNFSNCELIVSIATFNEDERKMLEPFSSSVKNRLKILESFSNSNVKNVVFFGPIYPTVTEMDLKKMIDIFVDFNVKEVILDKFNFKPGILENIKLNTKDLCNREFFLRNIDNFQYFSNIRRKMFEFCQDKDIKVIDAF